MYEKPKGNNERRGTYTKTSVLPGTRFSLLSFTAKMADCLEIVTFVVSAVVGLFVVLQLIPFVDPDREVSRRLHPPDEIARLVDASKPSSNWSRIVDWDFAYWARLMELNASFNVKSRRSKLLNRSVQLLR